MRTEPEYDEFVRSRAAALLRCAYALAGDRETAEDMLQTALMRTARHWATARDSPEAYTRRILVNLGNDRWRLLRRRPRESPLAAYAETAQAGPAVESPAELVGRRHALIQALARLPVGQRRVVVLRFLEDLSVAQTATLLGISEGTVKSYTSRALSSLRAFLDDQPDDSAATAPRPAPEVFHAH